jgi:hypothetical protein
VWHFVRAINDLSPVWVIRKYQKLFKTTQIISEWLYKSGYDNAAALVHLYALKISRMANYILYLVGRVTTDCGEWRVDCCLKVMVAISLLCSSYDHIWFPGPCKQDQSYHPNFNHYKTALLLFHFKKIQHCDVCSWLFFDFSSWFRGSAGVLCRCSKMYLVCLLGVYLTRLPLAV